MPQVFFTSDSHVGHRGILSPRMHIPRVFASIQDHDETLVARWNAVVRPEDTVWHLGDFAYRCSEAYARSIFSRLNGRKYLVRGNHDRLGARLPWNGPVVDVAHVVVPDPCSCRSRPMAWSAQRTTPGTGVTHSSAMPSMTCSRDCLTRPSQSNSSPMPSALRRLRACAPALRLRSFIYSWAATYRGRDGVGPATALLPCWSEPTSSVCGWTNKSFLDRRCAKQRSKPRSGQRRSPA
jgi:hypothetical protein